MSRLYVHGKRLADRNLRYQRARTRPGQKIERTKNRTGQGGRRANYLPLSLSMESASDSRFDPNYAMELLLDIGHEQSLENLLNKLVTRAIEQPTEVASSQVWLIDKAERCLRLAAAAGNLPPGLSESANTIAVGTGVLGQIAATGRRIVLQQSDGDWERLPRSGLDQARRYFGIQWLGYPF